MKTNLVAWMAAALFVLPAMAVENTAPGSARATDAPGLHSKVFDARINAWAEGAVSSIDYDRNQLVVHGKALPYLTTHAEMRKEFSEKMKNADPAQHEQLAAQIRQEWKDRLDKARTQASTEPEKDFNFKFAADGKVKNESEMRAFTNLRRQAQTGQADTANARTANDESQPKLIGELTIVEVYEIPDNVSMDDLQNARNKSSDNANANRAQERPIATSNESTAAGGTAPHDANAQKLTFRDIKSGDRIMIGFDSASEQAYMIVRRDKNAGSGADTRVNGR